jgi:hypothetical protein
MLDQMQSDTPNLVLACEAPSPIASSSATLAALSAAEVAEALVTRSID